jgi:hypothetical protein
MVFACLRESHKKPAVCGNTRCACLPGCALLCPVSTVVASRKPPKVTCEDCFFGKNMLCALGLDEACATFRPDSPEGLRPPRQMHFVFRQERRRQSTWQFPTAQEQAALHA